MMVSVEVIRRAAELIRDSKQLTVLTGAGVSKESGVPTFRDALDGLWAKFDPTRLATKSAFERDPKLVWDFYTYRRDLMRPAKPNPAHLSLDLHEQAGSSRIIRLHGNIWANKCFYDCQGAPTRVDVSVLEWDGSAGPPPCPYCGRWVRPDVVWFGEMLPPDQLEAASLAAANTDVMLVVGTSGVVQPAANLPFVAKRQGAIIIEFNPVESEITPIADVWLQGPSGEMLPRVLEALDDHA
jgi:NAD-dependent deacetylase